MQQEQVLTAFAGDPEELAAAENIHAIPESPLDEIALCLSGGGFRAASFSLGVLSYLHRVQYRKRSLLEGVKFITSTSGGTIANAFYSICVYRGVPFATFYDELRMKMDSEVLLKKAFDILNDKNQWTEEGTLVDPQGKPGKVRKQRNLINAFAKAYDELLFKQATLRTITDSFTEKTEAPPPLEETAFNTTEFNNGLAFYFQANGHNHYVRYIGNGYLRFGDAACIKDLKISDLVASSSCFPGGFEPMLFPYDYVHAGNTDVNALLAALQYTHNDPGELKDVKCQPFSLMDGGIVDNMGLDCVLKADRWRQKENKRGFDLILSCDVTSYFNTPLKKKGVPGKKWYDRFTIQGIINMFKFANIFLLLSLASIFVPFYPVVGYLLLLPSLLLSVIYWIGFANLKKLSKNENGTAAIALRYIDFFLELPFRDLLPMLSARVGSVSKLVGSLFLKQIRRGQYNFLFNVPAMKDRAIACLVYEFSTAHQPLRLKNLAERDAVWWAELKTQLMPSKQMQEMVDHARKMGTTLWFAEEDQVRRDELIATGQLTACYSLIKHICRLEVLDSRYKSDEELQQLKKALLADWQKFKDKPQFMVSNLFA